MNPEIENIGSAADTLDNLLGALELPLPAQMHIEGLTPSLLRLRNELRNTYVVLTGENPWKDRL